MSRVKVQIPPKFPVRVVGDDGINVVIEGNKQYIELNLATMPLVYGFVPGPTHYALIWDSAVNDYFLLPATSILP